MCCAPNLMAWPIETDDEKDYLPNLKLVFFQSATQKDQRVTSGRFPKQWFISKPWESDVVSCSQKWTSTGRYVPFISASHSWFSMILNIMKPRVRQVRWSNSHIWRTQLGGFNPSEKYEFVSWHDEIPNSYGKDWKSWKCSRPPTSLKWRFPEMGATPI